MLINQLSTLSNLLPPMFLHGQSKVYKFLGFFFQLEQQPVRESQLLLKGGYSQSVFKASHLFLDSHIAGIAELAHSNTCTGAQGGQVTDHDIAIWVLSWRPGYHSRGIAWTQSILWNWSYRHQPQLFISRGQERRSLAWPKVEKDLLLLVSREQLRFSVHGFHYTVTEEIFSPLIMNPKKASRQSKCEHTQFLKRKILFSLIMPISLLVP